MKTRNQWISAGVLATALAAVSWTAHAQEFGAPPGLGAAEGTPKIPGQVSEPQADQPATAQQEHQSVPQEGRREVEVRTEDGRQFEGRSDEGRQFEGRSDEGREFEERAEEEGQFRTERGDQTFAPRHERHGRAGLGVSLTRSASGIMVGDVFHGSPAFQAGLRPGDRLVSVNGQGFCDHGDAADAIGRMSPGERVALGVWRDGQYQTMEAELATSDEAFAGERMAEGDRQFAWEEDRGFRGDRAADRSQEMARGQFDRRRVMRPELEDDSQRDQLQQENESLRAQVQSLEQEVKQLREQLDQAEQAAPEQASPEQATPEKQPDAAGAIDTGSPPSQEAAPAPPMQE